MRTWTVIAVLFVLTLGSSLWAADTAQPSKRALPDGEMLYKTHCTRCHTTPPGLSERQTRVIVRHMRVRANLLSIDYQAVLDYLSQNVKAKN